MKQNFYVSAALFAGLLVTASCSNEELVTESPVDSEPMSEISVSAKMPQGSITRLYFEDKADTDGKLDVTWKTDAEETFSVLKGTESGTPVTFRKTEMVEGTSNYTAKFTATMVVDNAADYYAVYPALSESEASSVTAFPMDMIGQNGKLEDMENFAYMFTDPKKIVNNAVNFNFRHLTFVLRVKLKLASTPSTVTGTGTTPSGTPVEDGEGTGEETAPVTFSNVTISADKMVTKTTVNLTQTDNIDYPAAEGNVESISLSGTFSQDENIYFCLIPGDLSNLVVTADGSDGNSYSALIPRSEVEKFEAGKIYTGEIVLEKQEISVRALGDILLSSGEWVPFTDEITEEQKADAVGVVAYLYKNGDKKVTLPNGTSATGLVLALTNAGSNIAWRNERATVVDYTETGENATDGCYQTLKYAYMYGADGYTISKSIETVTDWRTVYPVFAAVEQYDKTAPGSTTGWYLPSIGEWLNILGSEGIGGVKAIDNDVMTCDNYYKSISEQDNAAGNLNTYMEKAGNYDRFPLKSDNDMQWFWSSSEGSITNAYNVYFEYGSLDFNRKGKTYPDSYCRVRYILAF